MLRFAFRRSTAGLSAALFLLACKGTPLGRAEGKDPGTSPRASSPTSGLAQTVLLDEHGPVLDLVASQALLHLYRQGLVIPFASPGFRKYSQEYVNPWRGITTVDEHQGRILASTAATLHIPLSAGADPTATTTLIVRVHGASAGKKLSLRLNGRPLKSPGLPSGWYVGIVPIPAGVLVEGENTLSLATGKKGAVFHSIEMVHGPSDSITDAWPATTPMLQNSKASGTGLVGFERYRLPVEIPPGAWLVLTTKTGATPARFRISTTPEGLPSQVVLDEKQGPRMAQERRIFLGEFADKLATLELAIPEGDAKEAQWITPRILLPATDSRLRPESVRNTILLVADALRADRLPMYAQTRVRTPNIAQAAESEGVTFTSTQAASPSSPPSHASIQSGCLPRKHGILGDSSKLNPGTPTISAILAKAGVATGFVGDASFAMGRLKSACTWTEFHQPNAEGKGGDCSAVVKQLLAFASEQSQAGKRFFLSGVAFEAHTPYIYHQGTTEHYFAGPFDPAIGKSPDGTILTAIVGGKLHMTQERWAQLHGLYDGEVEHLDGCFGTLMEGLQSQKLAANTAVVLLADHGEGFLEHGGLGHAFGHYAELTNVPLVFFVPGLGHNQKVTTVVGHADVLPTILDLMGLPPDSRVQGESLVPMVLRQGPWFPRVMPSEYGRSYSLRSRALHYIVDYSGKEYLYDIAADPAEKTECKETRPLALRYLRDLAGIYLANRARWHASTWGTLNNHKPGFLAATGDE